MRCDLCGKELKADKGKTIPSDEMKMIARSGFGPAKCSIPFGRGSFAALGSAFDATPEQIDEGWQQRVLADTTPWILCPDCYAKTRPFARETSLERMADKESGVQKLEKATKAKKPWIAAVLNLIFPGVGFFYIGSTKSIIGGMILFLLTLQGLSVNPVHPGAGGWAIIWAIIGYYVAKRHNKRNERSWW